MKRAALYIRVSTVDQHPETQLLDLRQFAVQRGLEVVEIYTDHGVCGTKARRPALDKMMEDARRHRFDVVLVWACDRLARSTRHLLQTLDELNGFGIQFLSQLGEHVRLADFDYTVVGLTRNMVGFNADPVIYARLEDAQNILFEPDPDLLRNIRARVGGQVGGAAAAPRWPEPLMRKASAMSENLHLINAIAVKVEPGVSVEDVASEIRHWKHLEVYSSARQINMQLMGANRLILMQLSLFRLLLLIIAGVIIGLITYTFTLDKIKDIAVLKLLGTQTSRIYSMIIQQAVLMGLVGTVVGAMLEFASEPYFPRRVSATIGDMWQMIVIIIVISILASLVAVRRAMQVDPRIVLGT